MSQYRVEMRGVPVPHGTYVAVCGTELVCTNEGFHVLEDNLRVPSGVVSYMVANRKAVKTNLRRLYRSCRVREVEHCGGLLRETLRELAPRDQPDPCVFRSDSLLGLPGLMSVYKAGNVTLVNAPGTGVADDKSVYAFVPDMIRYYLDEEPLLQNVKTYICRRPEDLEFTLDNLQNLIVKRVGESGGYGMLVGPYSTPMERDAYAREVRENPADFISQPVLDLSRAPCMIEGRAAARHVDLRPFVLHGRETRIVPGAFCRVALREGSLVVNSSQGGGGKDIWVLGD